jgi:ketosteroid isomerase-like protein
VGVSTTERIKQALQAQDLEAFLAEFDQKAVWLGLRGHSGDTPVCRNRDEVRSVFEAQLALGRSGRPEVVAETSDQIVVDMHPEPRDADAPDLHQILTLRAGKIVRMEDFVDRRSALAELEPS